jgi:hypothetical protein
MNILTNYRSVLAAAAGLVTLGATAMVWGASCIQGPDGTAGPIVFAKGKQSCDTISGYVGCKIDDGNGSCEIRDPADNSLITTITSTTDIESGLTWTSSGPGKVFSTALNGITQGNACVFFYPSGEGHEQSGIGYNTGDDNENPSYTNLQEAFFCTDLNAEIVTTEPELQPCVLYGSGGGTIDLIEGVDCGNFADGTIVEVYTPEIDGDTGEVTGQTIQQCICNDGGTAGGVYPCNLSGIDDGDPSTVEGCFHKNNGDVEAPIIVEFFPDAKRCKTALGTRSCDCIDNPFTACNECAGEC